MCARCLNGLCCTFLGGAAGQTFRPLHFLLVVDVRVIVIWIRVRSHSFRKPSKAYSVEEMERFDRCQNSALHCCCPVFVVNSRKFHQGVNMHGFDHASDTYCPREYMDCPSLFRIVAECIQYLCISYIGTNLWGLTRGVIRISPQDDLQDLVQNAVRLLEIPLRLFPCLVRQAGFRCRRSSSATAWSCSSGSSASGIQDWQVAIFQSMH